MSIGFAGKSQKGLTGNLYYCNVRNSILNQIWLTMCVHFGGTAHSKQVAHAFFRNFGYACIFYRIFQLLE